MESRAGWRAWKELLLGRSIDRLRCSFNSLTYLFKNIHVYIRTWTKEWFCERFFFLIHATWCSNTRLRFILSRILEKSSFFFFTVDSKFQNFSVPRWNQRWLFGNEVTLGQKRILIWKNSIVWRPIGSRDKRGKPVSPTRRDRYLNDWWQSGGRFCFLKFSPNYKRPCDDVLDSRSSFNDPPWEINFVIIITNLIGRPRATYFYSLVRRAPM